MTPVTDEDLATIKAGLAGEYPFLVHTSWKQAAAMLARIEAAEARVKRLEEALRPFARWASIIADSQSGRYLWWGGTALDPNSTIAVSYEDFRRARAALEGK